MYLAYFFYLCKVFFRGIRYNWNYISYINLMMTIIPVIFNTSVVGVVNK